MKNRAQATLEFTIIFIIMAALLLGLLTMWKWSSNNIIQRQVHYNETRLRAGSSTPGEPAGSAMFEAAPINIY
ncbi:MAG: hypothetical protein WAQ07_00095 [Candidatus Omnitrophota bacterium]